MVLAYSYLKYVTIVIASFDPRHLCWRNYSGLGVTNWMVYLCKLCLLDKVCLVAVVSHFKCKTVVAIVCW